MQRIHTYIFGLFVLVSYWGCERVVEYDLPGNTPKLVVNALFCKDSLLRIEVSASAGLDDGAKIQSIKDARIALFANEVQIKDFDIDSLYAAPLDISGNPVANIASTKIYYFKTKYHKAQSDVVYNVEVRYEGMNTVTSQAVLPLPMRATVVQQPLNESILVDGTPLDRLQFRIDDNGNPQNHYGLEILALKPGSGDAPRRIPFFSGEKAFAENLVVTSGQHSQGVFYRPDYGVYFSNSKFVGRNQLFEVYVDPEYMTAQYQLRLRLLSLSDAYFQFATSYQRQKQNANSPFAEPTQVYSNIEGGLGIFAGHAVTEVDF